MSRRFNTEVPPAERPPVKIVGDAPEDVKEFYNETLRGRFGVDHFGQLTDAQLVELAESQRPKEDYELSFIKKSNEILNNLLRDYGLQTFEYPERNIHFVNGALFEKYSGEKYWTALHNTGRQWILVNSDKILHPLRAASAILHEITHAMGYHSFEIYSENNDVNSFRMGPHREGLAVFATKKKSKNTGFFEAYSGLNEAVVEEITKRFVFDVAQPSLDNPAVGDKIAYQQSEKAGRVKISISERKNIDPNEILFVEPSENDTHNFMEFSYPAQRRVLNFITASAAEDGIVSTEDEAMDMFFKSYFTGHIKELAVMIDRTFGAGAFRLLKHMDATEGVNSVYSVLDDLQKRRRLKKSEKDVE